MAPRSFWKGYLKLSLVTCSVTMVPATTDAEKIRFHTLNRATGNRVESLYVDAQTGEPVDPDDEAKGYPSGENDYVVLTDEEIDNVALESTHTIDIETFVPNDSIDWIWYDKPHYLLPDDPVGEEAFAVIRAAMASTGTVGISRLVLYRRERAVLLKPKDRGLVLWTLHYGEEMRGSESALQSVADSKIAAGELALLAKLIDERSKPWDRKMLADPVEKNLRELVAKKKAKATPRRRVSKQEVEAEPADNVVSIMDALRKSLAAEAGPRKK
jgi:DNA end-binding protein Ku